MLQRPKQKCYLNETYRDPHSTTFCGIKLSSRLSSLRPDSLLREWDVHGKHFQEGFLVATQTWPRLRSPCAARLASEHKPFPEGQHQLLTRSPRQGPWSPLVTASVLILRQGKSLCSGCLMRFWLLDASRGALRTKEAWGPIQSLASLLVTVSQFPCLSVPSSERGEQTSQGCRED